MAIAADLLGVGTQVLRRLGESIDHHGPRTSGNHRRYSRNDVAQLARALELSGDGHNGTAIGRILELEHQVQELRSEGKA